MNGERPRKAPAWLLAATAGSTLVGTVVGGLLLDLQFGWTPWGTLIGLILGCFSCISILMRAAKLAREEPPDASP